MKCALNDSVAVMKEIHLEGNIIPMEWFNHITFENGKPDTNAILLLSDIVYWYRPTVVRDESSGVVLGYQKKFKADLLQKSYQDYESLFGFSKKQIRDSFVHLEDMGIIRRVLRTVETAFGSQGNVMFIELFPTKLIEITHKLPPINLEVKRGLHRSKEVLTSKSQGINFKVKTYTEITPKTTPETTTYTRGARADVSIQMLEVWNEALKPPVPVQMTSLRFSRLHGILSGYFQDDLSRWKAFCEEITRSSFLMGKGGRGWHVTLDWISDPQNLQKTLEGNYKDSVSSSQDKTRSEEESSQKAQEHIAGLCDPVLQNFSTGIIKTLGASCYLSWFKDVQVRHKEHRLSVLCPTRFIHDTIQSRFSQEVISVAHFLFPELEGVDYGVTSTLQFPSSPSLVSSHPEEIKAGHQQDAPLASLLSSGSLPSEGLGRWETSRDFYEPNTPLSHASGGS